MKRTAASQLHFQAVWPWASFPTSLGLISLCIKWGKNNSANFSDIMAVMCSAQGWTHGQCHVGLLQLVVGFLKHLVSRYYVLDPVLGVGVQR